LVQDYSYLLFQFIGLIQFKVLLQVGGGGVFNTYKTTMHYGLK